MQKNLDGLQVEWPAVCVVIGGKEHRADGDHYEDDEVIMDVSLEKRNHVWVKRLSVKAKHTLPTPDYVEMDRQTVSDPGLRLCGYMSLDSKAALKKGGEESFGITYGCGYPLIGDKLFVGLEHQAGFARIEEQNEEKTTYTLRHHPVWENGVLTSMDAVLCVAEDPFKAFEDYLNEIRLPIPLEPIFCFCSFWSDPYEGHYEYTVTNEAMHQFIDAYKKLGFEPDVYTFDAGWHNRRSIFQPKPGLEFDQYPDLSLWVSYNGPMGMDPEYLRQQGYAVGGGVSSAYSGDDYAVMMDRKLEEALTKRFTELTKVSRLFKIDWDNDCATSPEFDETYPTKNHVREASINAMNRITAAMRKANPSVLIRSGWWTSPWWLKHVTHVFLSQSGDSEYASIPALHQRAAAATHRDLMYYNHLVRDCTPFPLNSFDNHEFPHSIRNAFDDTDGTWTDNLMLCILRGSTYFSWTVQPESLTPYRADSMKQAMQFARDYAPHLFVKNGKMFGGHPGLGEVYGFIQPGETESWLVLRNPACMPQTYQLPQDGHVTQIYPDFRRLEGEVLMLPEEVKILIVSKEPKTLPYDLPFQMVKADDVYQVRFPASKTVTETVRPLVAPLHQLFEPFFKEPAWSEDRKAFAFMVTAPYRMKELRILFKVRGKKADALRIKTYESRYYSFTPGSAFAVPLTEMQRGVPGYGEAKNPTGLPVPEERYFSFALPSGGETAGLLMFSEAMEPDELELWVVGYEDRSAQCLTVNEPPAGLTKSLPPQHPSGFPVAVRCC